MNAIRTVSCACLIAAAATSTAAADDELGLGLKAGTLGLGVEATWRLAPAFDLRGGFNAFDYDETGSESGINYDADLGLQTFYATANFHVPATPLRFTAGAFSNDNELELVSLEASTYNIGGTVYTSDEVGTLRSRTTFDSFAPYAGIGFDFGVFGKASLNVDLGVLFQGDPTVTLESDGTLAEDPVYREALAEERRELEDEVDKLKAYPVLSLGLSFTFR